METKSREERSVREREYAKSERVCSIEQDPILSVIRVHLLTEHYLERILDHGIPRSDDSLANCQTIGTTRIGHLDRIGIRQAPPGHDPAYMNNYGLALQRGIREPSGAFAIALLRNPSSGVKIGKIVEFLRLSQPIREEMG